MSQKYYLKQNESIFFSLRWSIENPDLDLDSDDDNNGSSLTLVGAETEVIINKLF